MLTYIASEETKIRKKYTDTIPKHCRNGLKYPTAIKQSSDC